MSFDDEYFDLAAGRIIDQRKARPVAPPRVETPPEPAKPQPFRLKKTIRRAVHGGIQETDGIAFPDKVNTVTNRVHRAVRPLLARAYAAGFEAAAGEAGSCCGCNAYRDEPINPFTNEPVEAS